MRVSVLIAAIVVAVCIASMAVADVTTFQEWSFTTDTNPASPESVVNTYGDPGAVINLDESFATGWWDSDPDLYGSAQGWWDIGLGSIVLDIPNAGPDSSMDVELSIKYWADLSQSPGVGFSSSGSTVDMTTELVEDGPLGGGWYRDIWKLHIGPASDSGVITISADQDWGSMIDEVSVSTTSAASAVPEPGSLMALCAAVAGLVVRRRSA